MNYVDKTGLNYFWQQLKTKFVLKTDLTAAVPTGTILVSALSTVPTGFLTCDGSTVNRTTYADLFTAIGTTYGSGDGSVTFNLPNLVFSAGNSWQTLEGSGTLPSYIIKI